MLLLARHCGNRTETRGCDISEYPPTEMYRHNDYTHFVEGIAETEAIREFAAQIRPEP